MTDAINKTLALLFEPGQVIGVSGIRLDDSMTIRNSDRPASVILRHSEGQEL
jgi:hypothetical protein